MKTIRRLCPAVLAAALLAGAASTTSAGPPAVCHPIQTRGAVPIHAGPDGWADVARGLTSPEAIERALVLCAASDETFLHMETLRRCVIAITGVGPREDVSKSTQRDLARKLVASLRQRVEAAARAVETKKGVDAADARRYGLARFDLAYAAAALDQVGVDAGVDYDAEMKESLALCEKDGAMHLGAVLGTWSSGSKRERYESLAAALSLADEDELLEKNLVSVAAHFFDVDSISGLRARVSKELGRT